MNQIQKQKEAYYKQQGIAPGVPTMKGAYGDPENTGVGYNSVLTELGNHDVPQGWIQTPRPNTTPNTTPGPPVSWNDPSNPDDPQAGYGYIPNDTTKEETFFYHSDHLGSTSYITDDKANITQYDAYLPYGELLVDEHSSSEEMPYKFNGKEFDEETGLYYYGARYMNPIASLWYGVDPLTETYENISPYIYCANSPIRYTDPKGMEVEADELSMKNISYTLTKQEAKYVRFDKNGVLDKKRLNKSKSTSENMTALKALANSEIVYSFQVADKDHNNVDYYDNSATGGNYYRGTTEMPNAESNPSPDDKVYILVGRVLNEKQQVKTTAHEAFGHAYFYEKTRNVEQASHTYKSEGHTVWDEEFQMDVFESIKVPTNTLLENQINKVVKQAEENYDKRNKK